MLFPDVQSHINLVAATATANFVREEAWKLKSTYLCGLPEDHALASLFLVFLQGRYGAKLVFAAIARLRFPQFLCTASAPPQMTT